MSTTTYFIEPDGNGTPTLWREPGEYGPEPVPTPVEVIDLLRSLGVEDRTRPDWSDVPVGTAGTADLNDGENAGEFRAVKEPGGFRVYGQHGYWFVRDLYITDFTPDRVVDEELIGEVARACRGGGGTWTTHAEFLAATVERILRGES